MEKLGFEVFNNVTYKDAKWVISGPDCQILTVSLQAGETLECEPGSMMFMSSDTNAELVCGSMARWCAGESCCKLRFKNDANKEGYLGVTPQFPAKVIPVNLKTVNKNLVAKRGAYMAALGEANVTCDFNLSCAGCCGGLGVRRQTIRGDGTVFLAAGGTIVHRNLKAGEKLRIDTDSIVAYQDTLNFGINFAGNPLVLCFGGEGCFNTSVEGPGLIILQSMSFEKFQQAVTPPYQNQGDAKGDKNPNELG